jgi:hypothetical protein
VQSTEKLTTKKALAKVDKQMADPTDLSLIPDDCPLQITRISDYKPCAFDQQRSASGWDNRHR